MVTPKATVILGDDEFSVEDIYRWVELWGKRAIGQIQIGGKLLSDYAERDGMVIEGFIAQLRYHLTCLQTAHEALASGMVKRHKKKTPSQRAFKIGRKLLKVVPLLSYVAAGAEVLIEIAKIAKDIKKLIKVVEFAKELGYGVSRIKQIKRAIISLRYGEAGSPSEQMRYYAHFFIGPEGREQLEHFLEEIRHYYGAMLQQCEAGSSQAVAEAIFKHLKLGMVAMKCSGISPPSNVVGYLLHWLAEMNFLIGEVTLRHGEKVEVNRLFRHAGFKCLDDSGNLIEFDGWVVQGDERERTDGQRYGYRVATEAQVKHLNATLQLYQQTGVYQSIGNGENLQVERSVLASWKGRALRSILMECRCQSVRLNQQEKTIIELKTKVGELEQNQDKLRKEVDGLKKILKSLIINPEPLPANVVPPASANPIIVPVAQPIGVQAFFPAPPQPVPIPQPEADNHPADTASSEDETPSPRV